MERTFANVSESGELTLDSETMSFLGVPSGGEIGVYYGTDRVVLRRKSEPMSDEEVARINTPFARQPDEPSLNNELL